MADLIEIGVEVRTGSVKSANRELDSLGNTLKSAERSASAFVEAFERQERQVSRAAQSNRSFSNTAQTMYREILKVDQATKSASASASVFSANLDKQAAAAAKVAVEEERLRRKYVEGHAAMDLYSKELNDLAIARKADIISAEQQRQAVDRLNRQMASGTGVFSGYGAAQQAATRSSSQMGVVVQQTGYQVGDFLVQIQSGTNPMVAFGQQATQLVGVLPLMASRLGITAAAAIGLSTALGIGIPLLTAIGAAFMRSAESAKDAAEDVTSYKDAIAGLRSELDLLQSGAQSREVLQLNKEIASVENQIYAIKNRTLDLSYADAETKKLILDSALANSAATDEELQTLQAQLTELNMKKDAIRINAALIGSEAQEQQNILDNQRHQNRERIEADRKAKEAQEELLKLTLQVANVPAYIPMSDTARAAQEANAKMLDGLETAMRLKEQLGEGAYEALRLAGVDMTSGIDSAAKAAARLAADLNISLAAATAMSNMTSAEDLVMSQGVVKGRTADRYDVETLLGMGYTKEYLLAIGKIKEDTKAAAVEIDELQQEIDKLNKTAAAGLTPFDKYNKAINHLNELRSEGLSNAAYSMEIERLNDELAKSLPMVNDVADAFGDFLARGLTDFKSFANSIFKSFQNMLAQMIASAARNRILISMGATGSIAGPASAASNLAQGAGMMGSVGTFASSIGTGLSVVGNGFMAGGLSGAATATAGAVSGGIGAGGVAGFGTAIGAALPVLAAVAVAVALFRKKTKELDSGLNVTVENMDALVTSFKTVETSRFFGLSKKTSTSTGGVSSGVSDPIVAAVQQIQQSVLTAAEAFGFGASAFDNFSYKFKLSLKGLSEEQQMQKINEELTKMGDSFASLTGHFSSMNELLEAAEQRYQIENRMLQALGNSSELLARNRERELAATHALNRGLLQATFDLEDANAAVSAAMDGLRRAIDAEKTALQTSFDAVFDGLRERLDLATEAVSRSRNIFNMLSNSLKSRSLGTMEESMFRRSSALSFLQSGDINDEVKLENALRVVSEPSEGLFTSFVDYAREFLQTSRVIGDLEKTAAIQLSADEKAVVLLEQQIEDNKAALDSQLAALEQQYQTEIDQYNALMGIDTSVKSGGDAIATLRGAIESLASAQAAAKAAAAMPAPSAPAADQTAAAAADYQLVKEGNYWVQRFSDGDYFRTGHRNEALAAQSAKIHADQKAGQQFARGGMFNGGMRLVGEEGPELEVTGPSRIYSKQQTKDLLRGGDSNEGEGLRAEVSEMRQELRQLLIANNKYTKRSYDLYNKWDIDGLPAERT